MRLWCQLPKVSLLVHHRSGMWTRICHQAHCFSNYSRENSTQSSQMFARLPILKNLLSHIKWAPFILTSLQLQVNFFYHYPILIKIKASTIELYVVLNTCLSLSSLTSVGFPDGSVGKESCLQWRIPRFNPWVGKILWRRKRQTTPVLLPGKSHGEGSLVGYSPWSRKKLDMTQRLMGLLPHRLCKRKIMQPSQDHTASVSGAK